MAERTSGRRLIPFGRRADPTAQAADAVPLAVILDALPDPGLALLPDGSAVVSARLHAVLNEAPETRDALLALFEPADRERVAAGLADLSDVGIALGLEANLRDGRRMRLSGSASGGHPNRLALVSLIDITVAHDAQQRLARGREMMDSLGAPIWLRHADLSLDWVNTAYTQAVEASEAVVLAEQREIAVTTVDRTGRGIAEKAKRLQTAQLEHRHVVCGGSRRLFRIVEQPIQGINGEPVGYLGMANDVTEMEELKAELARHIAAQSEMLEQLRTGVAVHGADTRLGFHNSAFGELWGLDEALLDQSPTYGTLLELLRERRQLPEQADFRRYKQERLALFTSLIESHQDLIYRPDGTVIRETIVPHPMGGLMFTYEDVTSRLALESSYNTLIAVQRETLDNLSEAIAVFGSDGRLDLWNPAFARIWGLDETALDGGPHVTELVARLDPVHFSGAGQDLRALIVSNALDRLARSGRIQRGDGRVLAYQTLLLPDGAVMNSFLDVTDSVQVEAVLRERNAALEAADQLKLDFLANVSYQLRTPLNAIIGFGEFLRERYFGPLNDKQAEYVEGLLEAGDRLVTLIDAILDLSTIEAGYMRLSPALFDVRQMVAGVTELVEGWAARQEVRLELDLADVGGIEGDERRIKQVVLNLLSNAIRFTPPGGRVTLAIRRLPGGGPMSGGTPSDAVALHVTDTGLGISPEEQARVFEPFVHAGRKSSKSGAGVGLALVKSFVDLHGGTVMLKSEPGKGTSVTCTFPVRVPEGVR